jgi:succinyl-CoA synthetase beta subunit
MKLLEYQAKQQFAAAGIAIPKGVLARNPDQAAAAAQQLGRIAVKAQVPIGGRGKAGGVAVVDTPEDARKEAARILALDIRGYPVRSVWCETGLDIGHELYLGITLDRDRRRLAVIFSAAGGMEIEQVAEEAPEKIAKMWPYPFSGPQPYETRALCFSALHSAPDLTEGAGKLAAKLVPLVRSLYDLAVRLDAVTCEINPLVITPQGDLIAADGKLEIDENAEYRHQELAAELRRDSQGEDGATGDDPYEVEARKRGLTYVHLPGGNIGCIANGAGLAMNTLDLVKANGGSPNNFLDIGGGANAEKVRASMEMILTDPDVQGIFINIFGGITRGDEVARGIVQARDELNVKVPLVVRMTGTNEEEGRTILSQNGITPGTSAPEAAAKIVALVGGAK